MNKVRYYMMALLLVCATAVKAQSFVTVENGKLYRDGKPYTFIGTNWYCPKKCVRFSVLPPFC